MAANTLELVLRSVKKYYEKIDGQLQAGEMGLDKFLFNTDDLDTSAQFALDKMVVNPHGVSFRKPNEQSHVRAFSNGTGHVYEVPHVSEKTVITEYDRDQIVAGLESTSSQAQNAALRINKIVTQHISAHYMTRVKYAIDTLRTGKFTPLGMGGHDIGLEIDLGQSASNDITYDFTAAGSKIDTALQQMFEVYRANGGNMSDVVVIMGNRWYTEFFGDDDVKSWLDANASNMLLEQSMRPTIKANGLYRVATYRPGTVAAMDICQINLGNKFVPYLGATAVDFFPETEAIMFSASAPRYRVFRGVDAIENNKVVRAVGEIVFDSFVENDPIQEYIRTQTRVALIPANIDQVVRSTGNFPEVS